MFPVEKPRDDQRQTPKISTVTSRAGDNSGHVAARGGVLSPGTGDSVAGVVMKPSSGAAETG